MGLSLPIMGVPGLFGGGPTFQSRLLSLAPLIYWRAKELAGTAAVNYGSVAINGLYVNCTLAQPGQLGANEAFLPGANGMLRFANDAGYIGLQSFEYVLLVQIPAAYATMYLVAFGDGAHYIQLFGTGGAMRMVVDCVTTDATAITTTAVKPALNVWNLIFASYDATTGRARIRIGRSGVVTDCAYGTDTQGVGTTVSPAGALNFLNRQSADLGLASPGDEGALIGRLLTDAERLALTIDAGA